MIKRIKWGNIGLSILFVAGIGLLIHDFYMLVINPFFTGELTGYTLNGVITIVLILISICEIGNKLVGE